MFSACFEIAVTKTRSVCALLACLVVAACGGGGGGDPAPAPVTVNPSLAIGDASISEGDLGVATLNFTVTASATVPTGGSVADASVDYATAAGSASAGSDFTAASGTLQIPGGTTQVNIAVEIVGDAQSEGNETFTVTLSAPSNATISQATATGTIIDDDVVAGVFGLDTRPNNATCVAPARPTDDASVSVTDPYPSLSSFSQPTKLLLEPGGNRWFLLQKPGQIMTFPATNPTSATEYYDLTDTRAIRTNSEGGLLGMAFHPDYPNTPEIFLSYTIQNSNPNMRTVISRLIVDDVNAPGAGTSEQILLQVNQDFD
ncbi:MAG: Calx-beta domain-containing protein, partial [Pseudomonadota bacterium]